jgi:hypothetical protein
MARWPTILGPGDGAVAAAVAQLAAAQEAVAVALRHLWPLQALPPQLLVSTRRTARQTNNYLA